MEIFETSNDNSTEKNRIKTKILSPKLKTSMKTCLKEPSSNISIPSHIQKSLENLKLEPKPEPIEGYQRFEDSNLSTRTYIIHTNMILDKKFARSLPITPYVVIPKKRGRRKKVDLPDPNVNIPDGSIITVIPDDGSGTVLGVDLKHHGKKGKGKRQGFGNSTTIVMVIERKLINYKVSTNGKFQMTGVKNIQQAEKCIKFFRRYIKNTDSYTLNGTYFEAYFRPVMCNIGFSLGFMINRERLDQYFSYNYPQYPSLWENSLGSAGANIKIPLINSDLVKVEKIRFVDGKWMKSNITFGQFKNRFPDKKKKNNKGDEKYSTFLVFHKGKVNMSSMDLSLMAEPYYRFLNIIKECREEIEEKLSPEYQNTELK